MIDMPSKEDLMEVFKNNRSIEVIAELYYVSTWTIKKWAKHYNLSRSRVKPAPNKEKVQLMVANGMTRKDIAKEVNLKPFTLSSYIKSYGIETDFIHRKAKEIDIAEMTRLRVESKWTFEELAELYQVSDSTINSRCKEYGVEEIKVGRQHNDWKMASNKNAYLGIIR